MHVVLKKEEEEEKGVSGKMLLLNLLVRQWILLYCLSDVSTVSNFDLRIWNVDVLSSIIDSKFPYTIFGTSYLITLIKWVQIWTYCLIILKVLTQINNYYVYQALMLIKTWSQCSGILCWVENKWLLFTPVRVIMRWMTYVQLTLISGSVPPQCVWC